MKKIFYLILLFAVEGVLCMFGTVLVAAQTVKERSLLEQRHESAEMLKHFHIFLDEYAAGHDGKYPALRGDITKRLYDGSINDESSKEALGWMNQHVRYFGNGKNNENSSRTAIAYDNSLFENSSTEGTNVLFVGGEVNFIKNDHLDKLKGMPETVFEILDIKIDPVRQGSNAVRVKVRNKTEKGQIFRLQMYTRATNVGGWGTSFFDSFKAGETKWVRHACKFRGPVIEGSYIQLDFHNPEAAASFDMEKWNKQQGRTDWFRRVRFDSDDLEHYQADAGRLWEASKGETDAVIKTLRQIQGHIKNKEYETAWEMFTQDFREAEFQTHGFEHFKQRMESPVRLGLSSLEILALDPQSVSKNNDVFVMTASMKDNIWIVDFVQVGEKYKLDSIKGSIPNDWQKRLLPMLQKRTTKHFDIYYFNDSTAEKEIEQIVEEKDKGFEEVCNFLNTKSDQRIKMIFFEDGKSKQMATGHQGAGWAFGNTIVEIYNEQQKLDAYHETVHVLMRPYGNPPALFNEGFAVYMSEKLGTHALKSLSGGKSSIYERVRKLKSKNEWIPLEELITYTEIGSRKTRPPVSYPQAASFVKFLIDTYGDDKFLAAYKHLQNSGSKQVQEKNIEKLANIYGKSMNELKKQWHDAFMGGEN